VAAVVLTALVTMTGCGSATDDPSSASLDVDGRTFLSTVVTVDGEPMSLVSGTTLSLSFTGSTITANAGCNTMGGDATIDGGTLVVGTGLAMTEMGCDSDRMEQDAWFADLLATEPSVALDANKLTLESKDTVVTMTDEEVADPDRSLVGTDWTLDGIVEGEIASSVPATPKVALFFAESGQVQFSDGCNSLDGTYTVDGDTITLQHISTTLMACSPNGDVEAAVQSVLGDTVKFQIDGPSLMLNNGPNGLAYRAER
jgi:heat shock protein HslJ